MFTLLVVAALTPLAAVGFKQAIRHRDTVRNARLLAAVAAYDR